MKGWFLKKLMCVLTLVTFLVTSVVPASAQSILNLPRPGTMVALSQPFSPPLLKGIKVYSDNPFRLDFILGKGNSVESIDELKTESARLIKYFLTSVTVPEKDLWVNLSPYEQDRIVPQAFGVTEMGRDLLAQDYLLKQITASVIYPEGELGKAFWNKVYAEARKRYGTADIPVDTFNKVWIVPAKALVYESHDSAYVLQSRLKVLLDEDYLALDKSAAGLQGSEKAREANKLASEVIREVVIPILEKEVNEGKNFAQLRQIYHSLILAIWFKDKVRESLLGKTYVDQDKTGGVDIEDQTIKDKIWSQYVEAFKTGVYSYVKDVYDPGTQETAPRKYFSGGAELSGIRGVLGKTDDPAQLPETSTDSAMVVEANFQPMTSFYAPKGMGSYGDVGGLLVALEKEGVVPTLHGKALVSLAHDHLLLEEHIQRYSVIKNAGLITRVLQRKLDALQGKRPLGAMVDFPEDIYDALFEQKKWLSTHPMNLVLFRGGRGASHYTQELKKLPNVRIQVILGAVDDGRSWYTAARDFNATGIPDAGKSLLDLARDQAVKEFLELRFLGDRADLLEEDLDLLISSISTGRAQKFHYPQTGEAFQKSRAISHEKRQWLSQALKKFLDTFHRDYRQSAFSLDQMPIRSVVLLGAAWDRRDKGLDDYWQDAVDDVGGILDLDEGDRVLFPTVQRQYLIAMTGNGVIYGAETGVNEFLQKTAPFIGVWLADKPFDMKLFSKELERNGIRVQPLKIADRRNHYAPELKGEIESTTWSVREEDAYKTARLLARFTTTGDSRWVKRQTQIKPLVQDVLSKADAVIFGNTTFESNIGSSLVIPGMGQAIEDNARAVKIHIVNPTSESEPYGTTALSLLERLYRYATRKFLYTHPASHWEGLDSFVHYMIGVTDSIPRMDPKKVYLPFDRTEIRRVTRGLVTPVALDLEIKDPTQRKSKNYKEVEHEWGFYDPDLLSQATVALSAIQNAGWKIDADDNLIAVDKAQSDKELTSQVLLQERLDGFNAVELQSWFFNVLWSIFSTEKNFEKVLTEVSARVMEGLERGEIKTDTFTQVFFRYQSFCIPRFLFPVNTGLFEKKALYNGMSRNDYLMESVLDGWEKHLSSSKRPFFVGIAGESSSGKTVDTRMLVERLKKKGLRVGLVNSDDYLKPRWERRSRNLESIDKVDVFRFSKALDDLRRGQAIRVPRYEKETGDISEGEMVDPNALDVIIAEGPFAYASDEILRLLDHRIYIDETFQVRFGRRMIRDVAERGYTYSSALQNILRNQYVDANTVRSQINQADVFLEPDGVRHRKVAFSAEDVAAIWDYNYDQQMSLNVPAELAFAYRTGERTIVSETGALQRELALAREYWEKMGAKPSAFELIVSVVMADPRVSRVTNNEFLGILYRTIRDVSGKLRSVDALRSYKDGLDENMAPVYERLRVELLGNAEFGDLVHRSLILAAMGNIFDLTHRSGFQELAAALGVDIDLKEGKIDEDLIRLLIDRWEQMIAKGKIFVDESKSFINTLIKHPGGRVLFFHDNHGEVLLDLILVEILLKAGYKVTLVGRDKTTRDDVTWDEVLSLVKKNEHLKPYLENYDLTVRTDGTLTLGADWNQLSGRPDMKEYMKDAIAFVSKGSGNMRSLLGQRLSIPGLLIRPMKGSSYAYQRIAQMRDIPHAERSPIDIALLYQPKDAYFDTIISDGRVASEFYSHKGKLVQETQDFLDVTSRVKLSEEASEITEEDLERFNCTLLLVGSPSPETFVNAAKRWVTWKDKTGQRVPVIASTGRGRGVENLVLNTQAFFNATSRKRAKKFQELRQSKGERLTEAQVIVFILTAYGVDREAIVLEEESDHTLANMQLSYALLKEEILPRFAHQERPVKVQIATDPFHRLRAVSTAIQTFKDTKGEPWVISSQSISSWDVSRFSTDRLIEYAKQILGDPQSLIPARASGEIDRLFDYGLMERFPELKKALSGWDAERREYVKKTILGNLISLRSTIKYSRGKDHAQKGGIDLSRDKMDLQVQGAGEPVRFDFDQDMIRQLQNSSGLMTVIIGIRPMTVPVPEFLGVRKMEPLHSVNPSTARLSS